MKVLFCTLNSKYIHSSLAPWYLYAASKEQCIEGISLKVLEGTVNEQYEDVYERIKAQTADVICFSCYIWNIKYILRLCKALKQDNPQIITVLGGPEVSFDAYNILSGQSEADYVVSGEGEISVPALLNALKNNTKPETSGISFVKNGEIIISKSPSPIPDEPYDPYCEEYFLSNKNKIAYIESSRGCPFSCAFCLSGRQETVRFFDMQKLKSRILLLCDRGASTIKFIDRTFNCNKSRAKEILKFIAASYPEKTGSQVRFHFEIAADLLDEELFDIIDAMPSGVIQFEIGIQSFRQETLSAINRKTDMTALIKNTRRLISLGSCHIHIDLIAGLPLEGLSDFTEGFNKAYLLGADMLQLGFLKLLKGSCLRNNPNKYPCIYDNEPPYEIISTPYISQAELKELHIVENELERLSNSGRFRRTLKYTLSAAEITPYELFRRLGEYLKRMDSPEQIPLDDYTEHIFNFVSALEGIDTEALRNKLIYDRITTVHSGIIPAFLKCKDPEYKRLLRLINELSPLPPGKLRNAAILYGENKAIYCDYNNRHPITREYEVIEIPFSSESKFISLRNTNQ